MYTEIDFVRKKTHLSFRSSPVSVIGHLGYYPALIKPYQGFLIHYLFIWRRSCLRTPFRDFDANALIESLTSESLSEETTQRLCCYWDVTGRFYRLIRRRKVLIPKGRRERWWSKLEDRKRRKSTNWRMKWRRTLPWCFSFREMKEKYHGNRSSLAVITAPWTLAKMKTSFVFITFLTEKLTE